MWNNDFVLGNTVINLYLSVSPPLGHFLVLLLLATRLISDWGITDGTWWMPTLAPTPAHTPAHTHTHAHTRTHAHTHTILLATSLLHKHTHRPQHDKAQIHMVRDCMFLYLAQTHHNNLINTHKDPFKHKQATNVVPTDYSYWCSMCDIMPHLFVCENAIVHCVCLISGQTVGYLQIIPNICFDTQGERGGMVAFKQSMDWYISQICQ